MTVQKSNITLKYKEIDNGKKSIYLDYYKDGKRIREALHLYLLPEASKKNIIANKVFGDGTSISVRDGKPISCR